MFTSAEKRVRALLSEHRPSVQGDLDPRGPVMPTETPRPAAVLVLLERVPGYTMVFTKRTIQVDHHKGEVSFAGGTRDPHDATPQATALREAREELGLPSDRITLLGELDRLVTVTGFLVTPVVGVIDGGIPLRPSPIEVDRVLHVPLRHLRDPENWFEDERRWQGRLFRLRSCRFENEVIWGATSRMLQNFLRIIPSEAL